MVIRSFVIGLWVSICAPVELQANAANASPFHDIVTLDQMREHIRRTLPTGTPKDRIRGVFVAAGGATLLSHPTQARVEKYIYDIDLCGYYVWRWNISADFDEHGKARQIYVNGEPALADGDPARPFDRGVKKPGQKESISRMSRPRPQASKGESSLGFLVYDRDSDLSTLDDQQLIGGGPTRADPMEMGRMRVYRVEPWRSIFDLDDASTIAPYRGDCAKVDVVMQDRIKAAQSK